MIYLVLLVGPVLIILAAMVGLGPAAGLFAGLREIFSRSGPRKPKRKL